MWVRKITASRSTEVPSSREYRYTDTTLIPVQSGLENRTRKTERRSKTERFKSRFSSHMVAILSSVFEWSGPFENRTWLA